VKRWKSSNDRKKAIATEGEAPVCLRRNGEGDASPCGRGGSLKVQRTDRIAEEVRREVSQLIHFELSDPRIYGISVTGVKMTPDLRVARIYFTIPGEPDRAESVKKALQGAQGIFRKALSKKLNMKFVPNFEFFYDESMELQDKIDSLFKEIKEKKVPEEDV